MVDLASLDAPVTALLRAVARDVVLPNFRNLSGEEIMEKGPGDLVTVADRESEARLTAGLTEILPEARVIGEEACAADPALLDGIEHGLAWVVDPMAGAKPPSSPTEVESPASDSPFFSVWKISEPQRTASASVSAPWGTIMNSWKSMALSACSPPLMMFIIGTGSTCAATPPT